VTCYHGVVYRGDTGDPVWKCQHPHPTMDEATDCARELQDHYDEQYPMVHCWALPCDALHVVTNEKPADEKGRGAMAVYTCEDCGHNDVGRPALGLTQACPGCGGALWRPVHGKPAKETGQ